MTINYLCTQVYLKRWNCAQKILTLELSILMVWFILLCECSVLTFFAFLRFPQLDPLWLCLFYYCWEIYFLKIQGKTKMTDLYHAEISFSKVCINIPASYLHEKAEITNRRRDIYFHLFSACSLEWSSPRTNATYACCRSFGNEAVSTCFNDLSLSQPGIEIRYTVANAVPLRHISDPRLLSVFTILTSSC